jgi:malate/lactate dehydrogenase
MLAYACLIKGAGRTIALYGRHTEKVRAEVADLQHGRAVLAVNRRA